MIAIFMFFFVFYPDKQQKPELCVVHAFCLKWPTNFVRGQQISNF